ncbi:hypothetical protein EJ02DRAFT_459778, partial [Clathrospora elynae]
DGKGLSPRCRERYKKYGNARPILDLYLQNLSIKAMLAAFFACVAVLAALFARVVSGTATFGGSVGVEVERRQCQAILYLPLPDLGCAGCLVCVCCIWDGKIWWV